MRVALYARYSSEHQKESSIVDQFRNCEQRATLRRLAKALKVTVGELVG